jgi:O-antigen ligase
MHDKGFLLYLIFVISWFVHLPSRLPILGVVRFDFVLVLILFTLAVFRSAEVEQGKTSIDKYLKILIGYVILTIPFVEWPGSVLRFGLIQFIKAVVFYYFTIKFVREEKQLKILMVVFLASQSFRILEPLYLHVTTGYWGSLASMANWEYLNRLSGAPHDIVNPNGLAFIIVSVIPFLFYYSGINKKVFFLSLFCMPLFIWALMLTSSRSGFIALLAVIGLIVMKSRHKVIMLVMIILSAIVITPLLSADQQDRYLSITSQDTKNAESSAGRITGTIESFKVAFHKPLFGHGLGTSREANYNFTGRDQPAHNLYAEVAQELGFIGLFIFILYILTIIKELKRVGVDWLERELQKPNFLQASWNALRVFVFMNLLFSMASYGLSNYEWYFMPALIVILGKIKPDCKNLEQLNANSKFL